MYCISFKTKRLEIHDLSETDANDMLDYRTNKEVARYQAFHPGNINEIKQFIIENTKDFETENKWFQVGVFINNKLIGDMGIHFIGPNNSQCEIGYTISHNHQRMGYGKEAVTGLIHYIFQEMKKHRIIASLNPENIASIALLESIGFRKEGQFIKSILSNGIWEDDLVYAILEEEWKKRDSAENEFILVRGASQHKN